MQDPNDYLPTRRGASSDDLASLLLPAVLSVCTALLNAILSEATFPAFTLLTSSASGTAVALTAGILIVTAVRFPLAAVLVESVICIVVVAVPSLAGAALIAGSRRGARSPLTAVFVVSATLTFTASPCVPDGSRLTAPLFVLVPFTVGALFHPARQQRRQHIEQILLALRNAALIQERSARRERERMADELHDRVGHHLTAIEIQARLVLEGRVDAKTVRQRAATMRIQADKALDDIRSLVHAPVRIPVAESPTSSTCQSPEDRLRAIAAPVDVEVVYSLDGSLNDLSPCIEYVVRRLFQEGVTNVARHAPGTLTRFTALRTDDGIRITMANPTTNTTMSKNGRGLASLERRVTQVGGTLATRLVPGRLFSLQASLPMARTEAQR